MEPDDVRTRGGFPATRHSAIERIRDANPETRRAAFGDLVEGYWKPVYKYLRLTWRLDTEDARDLTQGFFADAFQKAWLERYEPGKARFRTFVRRVRRPLRDEHAAVVVAIEARRWCSDTAARLRRRRA